METEQTSIKLKFIDTFNDEQIIGTVEYFNNGTTLIKSYNNKNQFLYEIGQEIINLNIRCSCDEYDNFKSYVEELKNQLINQRPFDVYERNSDIDASRLDNEAEL